MTNSVKFIPTKTIDSGKALKSEYDKYNASAERAEAFTQKYTDAVNIQNARADSANKQLSPLEILAKGADIYGTIRKTNIAIEKQKAEREKAKLQEKKAELGTQIIASGTTLQDIQLYNQQRDLLRTNNSAAQELLATQGMSDPSRNFLNSLTGDNLILTKEVIFEQAADDGTLGALHDKILKKIENQTHPLSNLKYSAGNPDDQPHWNSIIKQEYLKELNLAGEINPEHFKKHLEPKINDIIRTSGVYASKQEVLEVQSQRNKQNDLHLQTIKGASPEAAAKIASEWMERNKAEYLDPKQGFMDSLLRLRKEKKISTADITKLRIGKIPIKGHQGKEGEFELILSEEQKDWLDTQLADIDLQEAKDNLASQKVRIGLVEKDLTLKLQEEGNADDVRTAIRNIQNTYDPSVYGPTIERLKKLEEEKQGNTGQVDYDTKLKRYRQKLKNRTLTVNELELEPNQKLQDEFMAHAQRLESGTTHPKYKEFMTSSSTKLIITAADFDDDINAKSKFSSEMIGIEAELENYFKDQYFNRILATDDDGNPLYTELDALQEAAEKTEEYWEKNGGLQSAKDKGKKYYYSDKDRGFTYFSLSDNNSERTKYLQNIDRIRSRVGGQNYNDSIANGAYLTEDQAKTYIERYKAGHKPPSWLRAASTDRHGKRADTVLIDSAIHYGLIEEGEVPDRGSLPYTTEGKMADWFTRTLECYGAAVPTQALANYCIQQGVDPAAVGY